MSVQIRSPLTPRLLSGPLSVITQQRDTVTPGGVTYTVQREQHAPVVVLYSHSELEAHALSLLPSLPFLLRIITRPASLGRPPACCVTDHYRTLTFYPAVLVVHRSKRSRPTAFKCRPASRRTPSPRPWANTAMPSTCSTWGRVQVSQYVGNHGQQ